MGQRPLIVLIAIAIVAAVAIAACGTEASRSTLDLSGDVHEVASTATVRGVVHDADGTPVVEALVAVGATDARTDPEGVFSIETQRGHSTIRISHDQYLPTEKPIAVLSSIRPLELTLVRRPPARTVTSRGARFDFVGASVKVPENSFPQSTDVTAEWLGRDRIASISGRALSAIDGTLYRLVGQLHVEASLQPQIPARLSVTLPDNLQTKERLVLLSTDSTEVVEAVEVNSREASFSIPHFSVWSVLRARAISPEVSRQARSWMLLDAVRPVVTGGQSDGALATGSVPEPGADLPPGTELDGDVVTVAAPNGSVLRFSGAMRLETDPDLVAGITCIERCDSIEGDVPAGAPGSERSSLKAWIRTKNQAIAGGVRGTVFAFSQDACSVANGSFMNRFEVAGGEGEFHLAGKVLVVAAGGVATGCEGCNDPARAECDCDAQACERVGGVCDPCLGRSSLYKGGSAGDLGGIANCVERGSICCNGRTRFQVCQPSSARIAITCQCADSDFATCATVNSACSHGRVVDCGASDWSSLHSIFPSLCGGQPEDGTNEATGDYFRCTTLRGDSQNCGSCGNRCCEAQGCIDGSCYPATGCQ